MIIKFKEFLAPFIDKQLTDFFKEKVAKNPDEVFEYVELVPMDNDRIILIYRQTNKAVYKFRTLAKGLN